MSIKFKHKPGCDMNLTPEQTLGVCPSCSCRLKLETVFSLGNHIGQAKKRIEDIHTRMIAHVKRNGFDGIFLAISTELDTQHHIMYGLIEELQKRFKTMTDAADEGRLEKWMAQEASIDYRYQLKLAFDTLLTTTQNSREEAIFTAEDLMKQLDICQKCALGRKDICDICPKERLRR